MLEQQLSELTAAIRDLNHTLLQQAHPAVVVPAQPTFDHQGSSPVQALQPQLEQAIVDVHNAGNVVALQVQPATPPPAFEADLDADGLPWDGRIHSSAKTKMVDGRWKLKRGVPPATVKAVLAELRSAPAPTQASAQGQVAPAITAPAVVHQPAPVVHQPAPVSAPSQGPITGPSYDEVKSRAAACSRVLGANAGRIPQLLGQYGVDRLSSLAPEHYAAFITGLTLLEQSQSAVQ